ncbi:MAG: NYN domain-containing protein [Spirochaetales bacterium]|nr:NYN domain-containing protein [Leptospiraceae bacterium]MCP5481449.1 NYN domain-containing protein [Spirochaetales bacterium]
MKPLRTYVYIDGFNLYYGQVRGTPHKWLDLQAMCNAYLDPTKNSVLKIKYFTAHVVPRRGDPGQGTRQQTFLRALATFSSIEIILGHFLSHEVSMPLADGSGYARVIRTEEKKSDVNIAVHMLHDAFQNQYDLAVLVSNDSDLSEALRIVSTDLGKKVAILNPHKNPSRELKKYALFYKQLRISVLAKCQLPQTMRDSNGEFHKPPRW